MPQRASNLWPRIVSYENLWLAHRKARRGKRDRPAVTAFEFDLEPNLLALQRELVLKSYQLGPYRSFTIREPKPRLISAAPYRDRVVHHILVDYLERIYEPRALTRFDPPLLTKSDPPLASHPIIRRSC